MAKPYREGDWFAVPLPHGGFAVGVIARANPDGVLLGYFFGPVRERPPLLAEVAALRPADACWVTMFGHLGLMRATPTNGTWPVIGRLADWPRDAWPMPVLGRYEELTGRAFEVHYAEDDPSLLLREVQVEPEAIADLPSDSLAGAGAVEIWLDHHLRLDDAEG